jgi:hypothetical protein
METSRLGEIYLSYGNARSDILCRNINVTFCEPVVWVEMSTSQCNWAAQLSSAQLITQAYKGRATCFRLVLLGRQDKLRSVT